MQTGDLRGLFNPEGVFLSTHGGGAGNNWGSGYHQAEACSEDILGMLGTLQPCIASLNPTLKRRYVNVVKIHLRRAGSSKIKLHLFTSSLKCWIRCTSALQARFRQFKPRYVNVVKLHLSRAS